MQQAISIKKINPDRQNVMGLLKDGVLIGAGIICAGLGLKGFLLPSHFIDGGVTGISLLFAQVTHIPLWLLIMLINLPFIFLGYSQISRNFAIKTSLAIGFLAASLVFIEYPVITKDKLLISIFGGFFLGAGIGLSIRGGGVLDGTEVLALYISRRTSFTIGDVIMGINIIIFAIAAFVLQLEDAMYSLITYMTAAKTVDFINNGIEEYVGVMIISEKSDELKEEIAGVMGLGLTIYKGEKVFGNKSERDKNMDILYSIIPRLELPKLKTAIDNIDPKAFIIEQSVNSLKGGITKRKPA